MGRAATRLGEKRINIEYSYCGLEPGSTLALVVFGVDKLTTAATPVDELTVEKIVNHRLRATGLPIMKWLASARKLLCR